MDTPVGTNGNIPIHGLPYCKVQMPGWQLSQSIEGRPTTPTRAGLQLDWQSHTEEAMKGCLSMQGEASQLHYKDPLSRRGELNPT